MRQTGSGMGCARLLRTGISSGDAGLRTGISSGCPRLRGLRRTAILRGGARLRGSRGPRLRGDTRMPSVRLRGLRRTGARRSLHRARLLRGGTGLCGAKGGGTGLLKRPGLGGARRRGARQGRGERRDGRRRRRGVLRQVREGRHAGERGHFLRARLGAAVDADVAIEKAGHAR
ncbi:hypothetical protein [Myxococcus hansupus]|uniref:hypothetical protein n=1 Tax=Pseudomyxococcus hansupus TaxID=1297742 RepID=UPI0011873A31|nr:hypothetical protein [Myxococcus hansupus]